LIILKSVGGAPVCLKPMVKSYTAATKQRRISIIISIKQNNFQALDHIFVMFAFFSNNAC